MIIVKTRCRQFCSSVHYCEPSDAMDSGHIQRPFDGQSTTILRAKEKNKSVSIASVSILGCPYGSAGSRAAATGSTSSDVWWTRDRTVTEWKRKAIGRPVGPVKERWPERRREVARPEAEHLIRVGT